MNDAIPVTQRFVGVLEDRTGKVREAIAGLRRALIALPIPRWIWQFVGILGAATRAADAFRPTARDKIGATGVFVREHRLELGDGKLMDGLGLLAAHGSSPSMEGYCHS